jgi:hypothetical protein
LAEDVDPGLRYEVEARLLAADTFEHIALRIGTSVGAIHWYEALFFHVADRRHNRGYLLHQAIGSSVHAGIAPHAFDLYWKLVGLAHGPLVLEAVIDYFRQAPVTDPSQVEAALSQQQRGLLRRQALRGVSGLRLRDPFAALQALEVEVRCQEAERQAGAGENRDALLQGIQCMLESLPWSTGPTRPPGPLAAVSGYAAEPRAHELIHAALYGPDALVEKYKDKKFPPPPGPPPQAPP